MLERDCLNPGKEFLKTDSEIFELEVSIFKRETKITFLQKFSGFGEGVGN